MIEKKRILRYFVCEHCGRTFFSKDSAQDHEDFLCDGNPAVMERYTAMVGRAFSANEYAETTCIIKITGFDEYRGTFTALKFIQNTGERLEVHEKRYDLGKMRMVSTLPEVEKGDFSLFLDNFVKNFDRMVKE